MASLNLPSSFMGQLKRMAIFPSLTSGTYSRRPIGGEVTFQEDPDKSGTHQPQHGHFKDKDDPGRDRVERLPTDVDGEQVRCSEGQEQTQQKSGACAAQRQTPDIGMAFRPAEHPFQDRDAGNDLHLVIRHSQRAQAFDRFSGRVDILEKRL